MGHPTDSIGARLLPSGVRLSNQLLLALPDDIYERVAQDLRMVEVGVGQLLHEDGVAVRDVHFPNGGVFSVTNQMRDGRMVEVATVGTEGMLGVSVFLGDRLGTGQTLQQVPDGLLPTMAVEAFAEHTALAGPFREIVGRYAQANLLQVMQCTACNALHRVEERCCRWLLQTHDRVGSDEFVLKHEFLAIMLGTTRPTVTLVMGTLQKAGLISNHYGKIRVLDRSNLEAASCECYQAIVDHFKRLATVLPSPRSRSI
jgi:CRP-like cAMP-binding protein